MQVMSKTLEEHLELIKTLIRPSRSFAQQDMKLNTSFYQYLIKEWETDLPKCFISLLKEDRAGNSLQLKINIYMVAAGLVAFGRKDVIPFLFLDVSYVGRLIRLRGILSELLPLPEELKDLTNKDEILNWLEINYDKLFWDENRMVYNL